MGKCVMFLYRCLLALFGTHVPARMACSQTQEKWTLRWGSEQGAGMIALTLKADTSVCRRCCGNPFLGEVLAGCLECLQLGRNEHASPRDVVCAVLNVEVGGIVSPATSLIQSCPRHWCLLG